ncbi:MAG TPA: rhodanese-like domain-containing protein [Anaerolineales bacterium]|jgi:3-mercaptopyruvate sulfurtransferase SseA|nr:hypothetical protein [Anaerolineae bacterium]HRJ54717.1 rhodanese-like domain-containing protein [Anaerolineales bacterium]HRK90460.1 rhodanese-like domain-containing protein [Anaerolineales bacterium]
MNRRLFPFAIAVLLFAALACSTLAPQAEPTTIPNQSSGGGIPQTEDQVPRISVSDAKAALDSGQAILVDVRSADAYASGHAAGAVSIPLENFENNIGSLSLEKSQWIITYCT